MRADKAQSHENVIQSCRSIILSWNNEISKRLEKMKVSEIREYLDIMRDIIWDADDRYISKRLRFLILKRDEFTCKYCGRKAPNVILHIDHVKPFSKWGKTDEWNLVTACVDCNLGKSNLYSE